MSKIGSVIFPENYEPEKKIQKNQIEFKQETYESFAKMVPQTGIIEESTYIQTGAGFISSIRFYNFNDELSLFWLTAFGKIPGVRVVTSIEPEDKKVVQTGVDRTIQKQLGTMRLAKKNSEYMDALEKKQENEILYQEVKDGNEAVNVFTINLLLFGKTREELDNVYRNVDKVLTSQNIEGGIATNEIGIDFNLTRFTNPIKQLATTSSLAASFPFYDQELMDPEGLFFGYTQTGGLMYLDMARKFTEQGRLSYDALAIGKKGSGKSVLLKNLITQEYLRGHQEIILDPEGEYTTVVKNFGGQVISVDKDSENMSIINPMEIRIAGEDLQVSGDKINLSTHIANLKTFISFFNEDLTKSDLIRIEEALRYIYIDIYGITNDTNTMNWKPEEFPKLSQVLKYFESLKERASEFDYHLEEHEKISITNIILTLRRIVEGYGEYFNKYSTFDIKNEGLITFDLKPLSNSSEEDILKAMMFNILNVFANRQMNINKQYNDNRKIGQKRRLLRITIDEAHMILNERNLSVVSYLEKAVKLFRKYSGGVLLASQDLEDFLKDSGTEVAQALEKIFKGTTYKFLMNQDTSVSNRYEDKLGKINQNDLEKLPEFDPGEFLLLLPKSKIFGYHVVDKSLLKTFETENVQELGV